MAAFRCGLVTAVVDGGAADKQGVCTDDLLVGVNGEGGTYDELVYAGSVAPRPVSLAFLRGGGSKLSASIRENLEWEKKALSSQDKRSTWRRRASRLHSFDGSLSIDSEYVAAAEFHAVAAAVVARASPSNDVVDGNGDSSDGDGGYPTPIFQQQSPYVAAELVSYRDSGTGEVVQAHIAKVHFDDMPPYYTIRLSSGVEKQTDENHLAKAEQEPPALQPAAQPAAQPRQRRRRRPQQQVSRPGAGWLVVCCAGADPRFIGQVHMLVLGAAHLRLASPTSATPWANISLRRLTAVHTDQKRTGLIKLQFRPGSDEAGCAMILRPVNLAECSRIAKCIRRHQVSQEAMKRNESWRHTQQDETAQSASLTTTECQPPAETQSL